MTGLDSSRAGRVRWARVRVQAGTATAADLALLGTTARGVEPLRVVPARVAPAPVQSDAVVPDTPLLFPVEPAPVEPAPVEPAGDPVAVPVEVEIPEVEPAQPPREAMAEDPETGAGAPPLVEGPDLPPMDPADLGSDLVVDGVDALACAIPGQDEAGGCKPLSASERSLWAKIWQRVAAGMGLVNLNAVEAVVFGTVITFGVRGLRWHLWRKRHAAPDRVPVQPAASDAGAADDYLAKLGRAFGEGGE